MGKYFVTLAKDLGYEPTLLALGRSIRYNHRKKNSWLGTTRDKYMIDTYMYLSLYLSLYHFIDITGETIYSMV